MWRTCVEFFADGACNDHRWRMLQRQFEWHGRVCASKCEACIALMDRTHGAAVHDHAAVRRGSQMALWSISAAETS